MSYRKINPLISIINKILVDLPSPSNISYMWNFGSLLGVCLLIQIITGLLLSIHFTRDINLAFERISHIIRNVNIGWLIRTIHANGASLFFIFIYLHIGRGIYYSSFHHIYVWLSGLLIIFLLIRTAFLGYVLPWGQISFWGATVITNLLSAIPYLGKTLTLWLWGGFSINNATLSRFFSLHFILPFILRILVVTHLIFLHETGSSNPINNNFNLDKIYFYPYFIWKDTLSLLLVIIIFITCFLIFPFLFSDPENFIPANSLNTPPHIQPEWYFLFAYAILRAIPNKLGGVLALLISIIIILILPLTIKNKFISIKIYPLNKLLFWIFINIFITLTYLGMCPIEIPYILIRQNLTILYFNYYIIISIISYNN